MSDARSGDNDPSMDDILASIRKIISDDEARAQVGGQSPAGAQGGGQPVDAAPTARPSADTADAPAGPRPQSSSFPSAGGRSTSATQRDDVLLLTDLVEEPKSGSGVSRPAAAAEPRADPPRIVPVSAAPMSQPSIDPAPPTDQSLVGASVAGAASSAFDRLSQAVQESVPAPSAPDPGPVLTGGRTLEDIVKEMLKPMLKEWLDRNLPSMVERFVEREIVRLTRR